MRNRRLDFLRSLVLCSLCVTAAVGCKRKIPEPAAPVAVEAPAAPAVPAAPVAPAAAPDPAKLQEGWVVDTMQNKLALCAFSDEGERVKAKAVEQVPKQVFRAEKSIVFGTFAPRCLNPSCDELSSLQCSVERSGNTLRLQTRYTGLHKDGAVCRDGCREATARCESPVLEAGDYKIEYSGAEISLKIPTAMNNPCFKKAF
jgi:hypothetical protein